ncbi:Diacylglycerol O-acyltransferase 2 [Chelonia mydas]|uniref:Diacylglycerol O-acyltransferase 2 n=1 Tax=Chelonia mydas TaxID=8469 RepID=M7BQB6_CHEMY|nr:Diacylglycerol O-acyltransferase 2 [Chelonia mydas]
MMKTIIAAYSGVLRGTGSSILSALQDLSWLSKSKVEKQLQIISVLQWILTFLVLGVACTVILMYILCTDCWVIAAVYLAWLVFDWNTPKKVKDHARYKTDLLPKVCPVNRDSIDYILSKNGSGNAIVIVVGGAAESLNCTPGKNSVTLKNRKGFVKLALRHGADLVPVYSFGENEVYKQVIFEEGSWGRWVQKKFQKHIGFAPCIFHGRGLFSSNTWGLLPYSKPITTVVGEPITIPKIDHPSQREVDFYHRMYVSSLIKLFDKYKTKFGLPETEVLDIN